MRKFSTQITTVISALLIIGLSVGFAYGMNRVALKLPLRQNFTAAYTAAVWDWSGPAAADDTALAKEADFLNAHQINTVYVDVSGAPDNANNSKLSAELSRYVTAMHAKNIRVYASAGNKDWSKPAERKNALAVADFAYLYNSRNPDARLSGLEFDIESYNQTGFAEASFTEKELVLDEFMDTVDALATKQASYITQSKDDTFDLGFAIPYWFDNENGNIKSITWNGKTGPVLFHILDRLNTLPKSNVVVMAYRNAALGNDGSIAHSRTEIDYAAANAPHVKVLIGQETTNVEPAKITFFGQTQTELSSEVRLIETEFTKSGVYGGVAINDFGGFKALSE
jgi:hypothetical protein